MRYFIFFLIFHSWVQAKAQDSLTNDLRTTLKLRKGVFLNFTQFKSNQPKSVENLTIKIDSGKYDRYWLYERGKKIRYVYGFSDGVDLFISSRVYQQTDYFVKVLVLGPIIYFEDEKAKKYAASARSGENAILGGLLTAAFISAFESGLFSNPGWIVYLPDEDGNAYILAKKSLKSIFKETDLELYNNYIKEKDPENFKLMLKYLIDFNERFKIKK